MSPLTGLHTLELGRCLNTTNNSIYCYQLVSPRIVLDSLTRLDTSGAKKLNNASLLLVAKHSPHLSHLSVNECLALNDSSLAAVAKKCVHLTYLNASATNIGDVTLRKLSRYTTGLTGTSSSPLRHSCRQSSCLRVAIASMTLRPCSPRALRSRRSLCTPYLVSAAPLSE